MSWDVVYGFPCVEDPNDFTPDPECSSPGEIEAHKRACATFNKPGYEPNKGCFSEHSEDGQLIRHVLRTSWGIGTNAIKVCDGCREPFAVIHCHECGADYCDICWPKHEGEGLDSERCQAD